MIKTCKFCESEFEVKYKSDTRKYCSKECAYKCPERNKNVSEGYKAFLKTEEGKKIYQQAMEKRNKLPYYQRREGKRTRERDIAYGRSEYKKWRISVLKRDSFTCRRCGKIGGILQAHHIKEWEKYPELRYDVDNGITLCPNCHSNLHGFTILPLKVCPICDKTFNPHRMQQIYCSRQCAGKKEHQDTLKRWVKICQQCKKEFFGFNPRIFCSLPCYHESLRSIRDKPCKYCGKIFSPHNKTTKYCSRECYGAATTDAAKKVCPICLNKFVPGYRKQVCCSKVCCDKKRIKQ